MEIRVAKRYAKALFQTALAANTIESVESDLASLKQLLENDQELRTFFFSPNWSRENKLRIATEMFSDRVTAITMQVIRLMLAKSRESELPALYEQFVELRRTHQEIQAVTISSAIALDEAQKTRIVDRITEKSGKRIEASFEIDPSLIGGVSVRYGDYVMDGSVRGSLSRLTSKLKFDVLKQGVEI